MFTRLIITPRSVPRLDFRDSGPLGNLQDPTLELLVEHLKRVERYKLPRHECALQYRVRGPQFVLHYDDYLPEVPHELVEAGIVIIRAEIIRHMIEPTEALPGYYRWTGHDDATAKVENLYPKQDTKAGADPSTAPGPHYAQRINVTAPSLAEVDRFHSLLCLGELDDDRVPWSGPRK